jgi:hypothetical protein
MHVLDLCFLHADGPLQGVHLQVEGAGHDVDHCLNKSMHVLDLCFLHAGGPLQGMHLQVEGEGQDADHF